MHAQQAVSHGKPCLELCIRRAIDLLQVRHLFSLENCSHVTILPALSLLQTTHPRLSIHSTLCIITILAACVQDQASWQQIIRCAQSPKGERADGHAAGSTVVRSPFLSHRHACHVHQSRPCERCNRRCRWERPKRHLGSPGACPYGSNSDHCRCRRDDQRAGPVLCVAFSEYAPSAPFAPACCHKFGPRGRCRDYRQQKAHARQGGSH